METLSNYEKYHGTDASNEISLFEYGLLIHTHDNVEYDVICKYGEDKFRFTSVMVSDIEEGLVVEYLMGAGQGNILGGDFSGNVLLGFKIEGGKIVGRVKDTMVSGNIYRVLKELVAIGSDSRWVGGMINTPSVYCHGLSVSAK